MIEITEEDGQVRVTYRDGNGNSATAVVVGESVSSVKDRAQEIVNNHNLEENAK